MRLQAREEKRIEKELKRLEGKRQSPENWPNNGDPVMKRHQRNVPGFLPGDRPPKRLLLSQRVQRGQNGQAHDQDETFGHHGVMKVKKIR